MMTVITAILLGILAIAMLVGLLALPGVVNKPHEPLTEGVAAVMGMIQLLFALTAIAAIIILVGS